MSDSGQLSIRDPKANLFGARPCPKCSGYYRIPYTAASPVTKVYEQKENTTCPHGVIDCESCGFIEPITGVEE